MFTWLWRRLGFVGPKTSIYDVRYGFPQEAVAEWLRWNPQLAAEHQAQERRLQQRLDQKFGKRGAR